MPNPYLGHLLRITAINVTTTYPPIPWITIELKIGLPTASPWIQYQEDFMTVLSEISNVPQHVHDSHHNYEIAPYDHDYTFDTLHVSNLRTLLNAGATAALPYDGFYPFSQSYFSAAIPALVEIIEGFHVGNSRYRLSGANVLANYHSFNPAPDGFDVGAVWATGAVIDNPPNVAPFPGAVTQFTVHYNNPDPYAGGSFPPGTGQATYELKTIFTGGGFAWARFGKV